MLKLLAVHIIILLIIILPAKGQIQDDIMLVQGGDLILPTSGEIPRIFGRDESGYYALGMDYSYYVEHYDRDLKSIGKEYLNPDRGLRARDLEALIHFHGIIYMFTSELRFSKKILYVQTISKDDLQESFIENQLMEIEHLKGWFADFHFVLSRKEDRLLIYGQQDALMQNIQDLYFCMYGKNLSPEWERKERIFYQRRPPRESTVRVSDEGNVFIMSLLDDQNLLSLIKETKNRYFLLAITDNGKRVHQYPVDFPNFYIRGLQIEPGRDHDLSCVGFYSPTHYRESIDGLFYFELNNRENRIENLRFHEIESYFLNEAMNIKEEKEFKEMFSFRISDLILRNNGDFIMIAENQLEQNFDNYLNIIAAGFSPGGQLNWKRIIQKCQSFDQRYILNYCSYAIHAPWYGNSVYLIFNDNPRNAEWPLKEKVHSFNENGKAVLKSVEIGPSGELSSRILYHKTRRRMKTPLPLAYYDPPDDDMIIPALRYRKLSFYRISF